MFKLLKRSEKLITLFANKHQRILSLELIYQYLHVKQQLKFFVGMMFLASGLVAYFTASFMLFNVILFMFGIYGLMPAIYCKLTYKVWMQNFRYLLSFLVMFIFSNNMNGATVSQSFEFDKIKLDKNIAQLMTKYNVPNVDVMVLKDDSIVYQFSKNPRSSNEYLIGSCSKSFTAIAIMKLVDERKIDLDKPIINYLPWFSLKDASKSNRITIRHLLNQTSGISSKYGFFDCQTNDKLVFEKQLSSYLKAIDLQNDPGCSFLYSNMNYLLLGLVIEHVTNMAYSMYLDQYILKKLNMPNTFASVEESKLRSIVLPYHYFLINQPVKSRIYRHSEFLIPYGLICSNVNDLKNYLYFMQHKGITVSGDTLLSGVGYNNLIKVVKGNYAMGWFNVKVDSVSYIFHGGLNENYSSAMIFFPEYKMSIALLSNINSNDFCNNVQATILMTALNKPVNLPPSMEIILRWAIGLISIFVFICFIVNIIRWRKTTLIFNIVFKVRNTIRLVLGIILSNVGMITLPQKYSMTISAFAQYQPDIMYGLIFIAIIGTVSSLIHFLCNIK